MAKVAPAVQGKEKGKGRGKAVLVATRLAVESDRGGQKRNDATLYWLTILGDEACFLVHHDPMMSEASSPIIQHSPSIELER